MSGSVTMGSHGKLFMSSVLYRWATAHVIAPWGLQGARPKGDVLEIGGGTGAMADHLLRSTPGLHMVVTDVDPDMVATARRTLQRHRPRVAVEVADAGNLPFGDGTFDFVISCLMLHHTADWRHAVAEALRVLRPGGRLVGFDLLAGAPLHHPDRFTSLMKRGELAELLAATPNVQPRLRTGLARAVVRFDVTRTD
jgi:ubiquinone/menaquinone biosynthesis C-methylase UbiE